MTEEQQIVKKFLIFRIPGFAEDNYEREVDDDVTKNGNSINDLASVNEAINEEVEESARISSTPKSGNAKSLMENHCSSEDEEVDKAYKSLSNINIGCDKGYEVSFVVASWIRIKFGLFDSSIAEIIVKVQQLNIMVLVFADVLTSSGFSILCYSSPWFQLVKLKSIFFLILLCLGVFKGGPVFPLIQVFSLLIQVFLPPFCGALSIVEAFGGW
ncbi:hypothetical protein F0562_032803 [Nyssa sinensis]|uniref:Uncharacterized protein n=1 Tax=Nyssa sinensis TaxID=561372 RepID=A0A5J5AQ95_9ASTE|nr:hypothetical protein F0562_032803 [Nyssa sinensis]